MPQIICPLYLTIWLSDGRSKHISVWWKLILTIYFLVLIFLKKYKPFENQNCIYSCQSIITCVLKWNDFACLITITLPITNLLKGAKSMKNDLLFGWMNFWFVACKSGMPFKGTNRKNTWLVVGMHVHHDIMHWTYSCVEVFHRYIEDKYNIKHKI